MELKDSGISWIGNIPAKWGIDKIGSVYIERRTIVSDEEYEPLSVTKTGIVPQLDNAAKSDAHDNRKLVVAGDFVINSRSDRKGSSGISNLDGSVSLINTVLEPRANMNNKYYNFVFKTDMFCDEFYKWGHGIVADLWTTRWTDMKNIYVPRPDLSEQKAIADYLDKECARIDDIVEKQRNIIEKLKEYKKSVITEAVTKGLNPNVTMKDSGIEWIGKIPAHWEVCKIKNIICSGKDGIKIGPFGSALTGKTRDVGEYRVYSQANLVSDNFDFAKNYIEKSDLDLFQNYIIKSEDILLSMMGTIGKCKIMPKNKPLGIMDSHLLKIRLSSKYIPKFFAYVYDKDSSNVVISQLLYYSKGSIMDGLNSSIVKNIQIPLASLSEQQAIIEYLDQKCGVIDSVIEKRERMIELLTEYKKSLIYECVTGKKEVA